jgi:hypothetical protein
MFGLTGKFFDTRHPIEGVAGQNMFRIAKHMPSYQDSLHITDKTSAEWIKTLALLGSSVTLPTEYCGPLYKHLSFAGGL